jgi:hypothetical protein
MPSILHRLLRGSLRADELPLRLDLGPLWPEVAELCRRSLGVDPAALTGPLPRGEAQRECGACLVVNGSRVWLGHWADGSPDWVNPGPGCIPYPQHAPPYYGGFAHTHLPDRNTNLPIFGFSSLDYRATLADGDNLALVCNGPHVFALARTDATQPRRVVARGVFERWRSRYEQLEREARAAMRNGAGGSPGTTDALSLALWRANQELCEELGFAFYWGRWGEPLALLYQPEPGRERP